MKVICIKKVKEILG